MAGVNSREGAEGEDGLLTALEASYLDLDGVDLVTLSACDTARGAAIDGEGVLGLVRGFQTAGARNLVASRWPVDDLATRLLMEGFYEEALRTDEAVPAATALRRAALALRDRKTTVVDERQSMLRGRTVSRVIRLFAAPRHWAAFAAYGREH